MQYLATKLKKNIVPIENALASMDKLRGVRLEWTDDYIEQHGGEDEYFRPHDTAVISIPQKAPEGAILRDESPIQLLERIKRVHLEWVKPGHITGMNTHNVSATVSVKEDEWDEIGSWMWKNKDHYNGLSVLPYNGGTYIQAPFEDITIEKYDEMMKSLTNIDLTKVIELDDNTNLKGEAACAGGACEIV